MGFTCCIMPYLEAIQALMVKMLYLCINKYFILFYLIPCCIFAHIQLNKLKPLYPKTKKDFERDLKYDAFVRHDLDNINRLQCFIKAPFMPIQFVLAWFQYTYVWALIKAFKQFKDDDKAFKGILKMILLSFIHLCGWAVLSILGISKCEIIEKKADYSEYLGPDWEMTFDNPGTIVSNHQGFMDIVVHHYVRWPAHLAKKSIRNIPFIGLITEGLHSLFVDREDKDNKKSMLEAVKERQIASEKGEWPPLIIYPEGGTTNGKYLIKFKKGAFASLRSVKPVIIKYHCPHAHLEGSNIPFSLSMFLIGTNFASQITEIELPVFLPNDYFFQHHTQPGEQQWETFARVIRELMAKHGDLKLSELSVEDKFEYKRIIYGDEKNHAS